MTVHDFSMNCVSPGLAISMRKVILQLLGPFDAHTGFRFNSFFSSSSYSLELIIQSKENVHQQLSFFSSCGSLCTQETLTVHSLLAFSDIVLEQLSIRLQDVCAKLVHKHFSIPQDPLDSCFGCSISPSSVVFTLYAYSTLFLCAFVTFAQVIMSYAAPCGTGTGAGQVTPLNNVKFDIAARASVATKTGCICTARDSLKDEGLASSFEMLL